MGLIAAFGPALEALQSGRQLKNRAAWKNVQVWATLLTAVAGVAGAFWPPFAVAPETVAQIAVGIVAAVNLYFTYATSDQVGFGGSTRHDGPPARVGGSVAKTDGAMTREGRPAMAPFPGPRPGDRPDLDPDQLPDLAGRGELRDTGAGADPPGGDPAFRDLDRYGD